MVGSYPHIASDSSLYDGYRFWCVQLSFVINYNLEWYKTIVDNDLAANVFRLTQMNVELCVKFAAVVFFTPKFLFPGIIFTVLGGLVGQIYMQAQLPVKRVTANAKSPVIGQWVLFNSSMSMVINLPTKLRCSNFRCWWVAPSYSVLDCLTDTDIFSLVSIRAYGAEEFFIQESVARLEKWIHPLITFYGLNRSVITTATIDKGFWMCSRWVCIRTEALSGIFTASLAWYLIYGTGKSTTALDTGFSIMTASASSVLIWSLSMTH